MPVAPRVSNWERTRGRGIKLEFEDCVFVRHRESFSAAETIVPIEPKMYMLLEVLIQRRPAVVTNVELDEVLWPNVYVERSSLTRLVSELRTVLGDSPRESRIIRTVYKSGYFFRGQCGGARWRDKARFQTYFCCGTTARCISARARTSSDEERSAHWSSMRRRCRGGTQRITVSRDAASIEDLESTNGTFVNKRARKSADRAQRRR